VLTSNMPLTSSMLPIGTPLPDLVLPDLTGHPVDVRSYAAGRPLVLAFVCNHCPYVQHIEGELGVVADTYTDVAFIAICSNDAVRHPEDAVDGLLAQVERVGWRFPYLVDADQAAAHTLHAVCTPDFFCFDRDGFLAYRGAFDDARPSQPTAVTGSDLRSALDHIRAGQPVPEPHRPSMGCGIKWRPGNEPA